MTNPAQAHCDQCGEPLKQEPDGTWLHARNPASVEPALCVTTLNNGVPGTWAGAWAEPCTNPDCDWELELPWWEETA